MDPLVVYFIARVIAGISLTMYGLIYHLQTGQLTMLDMLIANVNKDEKNGFYYYDEDKSRFTYTIGVLCRNAIIYGLPPIAETVLALFLICLLVLLKCAASQIGKIEIRGFFTKKDK